MDRSYRITPVYTGDVSGVCSALYELGGMTVMHDPSGCNSTYNTHDETRWYNQDSLIFLSGLKHRDAVMGNDSRLIEAVLQAAEELRPKFITLCNSPIPYINGTDFNAIGRIIEEKAQVPVLVVPTNGMHDYTVGAGEALKQVALRLVSGKRFSSSSMKAYVHQQKGESADLLRTSIINSKGSQYRQEDRNPSGADEQRVIPHSLNILGMTPLDFSAKGSVESLKAIIEDHGWQIISNWAMNTSLEECQQAGRAQMNLVVSSVGLEAAKVLEQKFGTPYVVGCPMGKFTPYVFMALEKGKTAVAYISESFNTLGTNLKEDSSIDVSSQENNTIKAGEANVAEEIASAKELELSELNVAKKLTLIGEAVTMCSLAAAIELKQGMPVQVLCPLETHKGLLGANGVPVHGEEQVENYLKTSSRVMADPLYQPLCAPGTEFIPLPHQAFSGRCFRKKQIPLFQAAGAEIERYIIE